MYMGTSSIVQIIYSTKKLRKMCSSDYYNKSSKELEIQNLVCYKVSFYLSNEVSFELVASAVAEKKTMSKLATRQSSFHKIAILFGLSKRCQ